ncbi:MAG TPA: methyltransferase domain-containing protein [Candidatus Cybelea sp.]|nr:methyltransferase domain-containing protein [Candidatus Cybelea sp.]
MSDPVERRFRSVANFYASPALEWQLRMLGTHLHPGFEDATVALASRAAHYGFAEGGIVVELASALGGPARYVARRFAATVICVDFSLEMQSALARGRVAEGMAARCVPVVARTENLPLASSSCDAAWSQDALCHMDKGAALSEVARVLRTGAVFAFTDFIARSELTRDDALALEREWAFPSLMRLADYSATLDACGFELLLAEDRTRAVAAQHPRVQPLDQSRWEADFAARRGRPEIDRQNALLEIWANLVRAEHAGYGMFIARRRLQ